MRFKASYILLFLVLFLLLYSCKKEEDIIYEAPKQEPVKIETSLPLCYINTPNSQAISSKEKWINSTTLKIVNPNGKIEYKGVISIKGRGNSSWLAPKKPYTIKLEESSSILGMAPAKKWILLSNWIDRTLMRNAVAFEISKYSGLDWTPHGKYVEVILNGKHIGNYYLCEKIEVHKNRVNIEELNTSVIDPNLISGGYLFELDNYYDETFKFISHIKELPYMFSDPNDINIVQQTYGEEFVANMENVICGVDKTKNLSDFINIESFVDWWFVTEITMNAECFWPKSCYMHKNRDGVMKAGPVWDFDWGTFTPDYSNKYVAKSHLYYPELFQDATFVSLVKSRWGAFKESVLNNIPTFIDNTKEQIRKSDEINSAMWPISDYNRNGDEDMTFDDAVERLKTSMLQKIDWLDAQIAGM